MEENFLPSPLSSPFFPLPPPLLLLLLQLFLFLFFPRCTTSLPFLLFFLFLPLVRTEEDVFHPDLSLLPFRFHLLSQFSVPPLAATLPPLYRARGRETKLSIAAYPSLSLSCARWKNSPSMYFSFSPLLLRHFFLSLLPASLITPFPPFSSLSAYLSLKRVFLSSPLAEQTLFREHEKTFSALNTLPPLCFLLTPAHFSLCTTFSTLFLARTEESFPHCASRHPFLSLSLFSLSCTN